MATRKNTAPAVAQSVDASPDIQRTIAEAIELVETTQRALEPNEQRASEYGALGQAVAKLWNAHNQVERLPWAAPAHAVPDSIARAAVEAPSPAACIEFDELLERLLNVISHLKCADGVLFDLQGVPEPLQGAVIVLHDAIENLGALHTSLDEWAAKASREARYAGAAEAHDARGAELPEAPSAPDVGSVAAELTGLFGATRLAYVALSDFHDVPIGHVITKDDTETLGAVHSQIARVAAELDDLAAELMGRGAQS